MQINIVPAEYKPETKNDHRNTFRTIPVVIEERNNNSEFKIPNQGFIKSDKTTNWGSNIEQKNEYARQEATKDQLS